MPATGCNPGPRPAFIPAPSCAKAVLRYSMFGQTIENVWHFLGSAAWTIAQLEALATSIRANFVVFMEPELPPQITLVDITCTALDANTGPQWTELCDLVGTNVNAAFADPGATFAIKFVTDKIGRSYRGRMYWPALLATNVTGGTVSGTYANAITTSVKNLIDEVQIEVGAFHCVVSYQHNCAWRAVGVGTPVVGYTYTDLNIDSQRRRLIGRGI